MIFNMPPSLFYSDRPEIIPAIADHKVDDVNKTAIKPKPATTLILPWPDKNLSPNQRIHWAKRAQAVKTARQIGFNLAHLAGWNRDYFRKINLHLIDKNSIDYLTKRYDLMLDFYPPNKRRRDDDNLIASFKPYRDGIASALGMDDFRFRTVATVRAEVIKNGRVKVGISINNSAL